MEGKNIVKEGEVDSVGITPPMHTRAGLCQVQLPHAPPFALRHPQLFFTPWPEDPWCSGTPHGPTSSPGKSVYAVVTQLEQSWERTDVLQDIVLVGKSQAVGCLVGPASWSLALPHTHLLVPHIHRQQNAYC